MNELARHIERLLLTHDCVVVPQFGGFVTMSISATRDDGEQCFFPPLRIVRFNPSLLEEDGLLLADVRASLSCTEVEAKRHIQRLVLDLRQQLLSDGQVDFGTIGLFQQDEDCRVSFSPCQAGVVTPNYFGLDAFALSKLSVAQRNESGRGSHRNLLGQNMATESQNITIHINKRSLKNIVAAAAIMILCALFSTPADDISSSPSQASILSSEPVAEMSSPQAQPQKKEIQTVEAAEAQQAEGLSEEQQSQPATPEAAAAPTAEPATPSYKDIPNGKYCIVLASNVSLKNANRYVETLRQRGLSNARVYNNGRMNRVIIDGFQSENEAYNKNTELHHTDREYSSTWVMAL